MKEIYKCPQCKELSEHELCLECYCAVYNEELDWCIEYSHEDEDEDEEE